MKSVKTTLSVQRRSFIVNFVNGFVKQYSTGIFSFMIIWLFEQYSQYVMKSMWPIYGYWVPRANTQVKLNGCNIPFTKSLKKILECDINLSKNSEKQNICVPQLGSCQGIAL